MYKILIVILFLVGVIHLLPVTGVLGMHQLSNLYGIQSLDKSTELLMRHRAILLSLIGMLLIASTFVRHIQVTALIIASISVGSFIALWLLYDTINAELRVVALVDIISLILLVVALGLYWQSSRNN